MPLSQWSTRRILALWCASVLLALAVNILAGSQAFKSALFFDYIFQLIWILLLLPVIVITYIWAHVRLSEPAKTRIKTLMIAVAIIVVMFWLRFSCTRFH